MRIGLMTCALAALLGACGGGGGSGSSGGAGSAVSVALASPASVNAEVIEGGVMPNVTLVGTATGDLASLSGKTIYVIVVDPDGLYEANPFVTFTGGTRVNVDLRGAVQTVSHHVTGNLTINVCLDVACTQHLGGSPLRLPYDVDVPPGITVSSTPIAATYRFGDAPTTKTLAVTLPKYLTGWIATAVEPDGSPSRRAVAATSETGTSGVVTLTFTPTEAGVYTGVVRINTAVAAPSGTMGYVKEIPYTYTVTDNPAVFALYFPTQLSLSIKAGTENALNFDLSLVVKPGVTNTISTVEYLTAPAAAATHPNVNGWVFLGVSQAVGACFRNSGPAFPPDCLPVGTYTGRVHSVVTDGASLVDVYAPVTLVVTP